MTAITCHDAGIRFSRGSARTRALAAVRRAFGSPVDPTATTWALRHVDLELPDGTRLGVCGKNGAGKTTLMRMLCGIYKPDEGAVAVRGETSALLSLGTGIAFNLSGRRNVYVAGAVRGLTRAQIDDCYADVCAFAELDEAVMQSPVRHYSTGMRARLGFAISSVMTPDILLVDELLSVGDAAFREKSAARLEELAAEARCVVISSHDLKFMREHCDLVLWLHQGRVMSSGESGPVLDEYLRFLQSPGSGLSVTAGAR